MIRFETSIDNNGNRDTLLFISADSVTLGYADGVYGIAFGGDAFDTTEDAWIGGVFDGAAGAHYGIYFQVNDTVGNFVQPVLLHANNKKFGGTLLKINAGGSGKALHITKTDTTAGTGFTAEDFVGAYLLDIREHANGVALRVRVTENSADSGVGLQLGDYEDSANVAIARLYQGVFEVFSVNETDSLGVLHFIDSAAGDTTVLGKAEYDSIWAVVNQVRTDSGKWVEAYDSSQVLTANYEPAFPDSGTWEEVQKKVVLNTAVTIGNVSDTNETDSLVATHGFVDSSVTNVVLNDALIKGKLEATAGVLPWNWKWTLSVLMDYDDNDYFAGYADHADTNLLWPTDSVDIGGTEDDTGSTYAAGHPDWIEIPGGWPRDAGAGSGNSYGRWTRIASHSPLHDSLKENPCLIVYDDVDSSWKELYVGEDSAVGVGYNDSTLDNPLWDESDFGAGQLMDPNLEFTHDGAVLLTFRGEYAAPGSTRVFSTWSFDGLTWDSATIARDAGLQSTLSPSVITVGEDEYKMFCVDGSNYGDSNVLELWTAGDYDTVFVFDTAATINIPLGYHLWHIKVRPLTPQHLYMLAYCCDSGAGGTGSPQGLFWYWSDDGGINWDGAGNNGAGLPFLIDDQVATAWNGTTNYRGSWIWERTAQGLAADVVYGGYRLIGGIERWRVGQTRCYFYPEDIEWADTAGVVSYAMSTKNWVRDFVDDTSHAWDSTYLADNSVSEDDMNWRWRWEYLTVVHGFNRAKADSFYLSFPCQAVNGDTTWLLTDSAGNIDAGDRDTFNVSGYVPFACTIDSVEVMYLVSSGSEIVDGFLKGPTLTSTTNLTDSTYESFATDLTSTSWDTAFYSITDISAAAGDRFSYKCIWQADADNDRLRIGWARIRVKR
jgi:hypothetical protein